MRWIVLLIAGGCGRLAFDPYTSGGHDEDSDRVADVDDVCPFLADPSQADADGDGVGDACDPNPATPSERIALFFPFTPDDPLEATVQAGDGWQPGADSWQTTGTPYARLEVTMPLSRAYIDAAFEIIENPTPQRQIGIAVYGPGSPYYYGEVFDGSNTSPQVDLTHYDGASYNLLDFAPVPVDDFFGAARLRLSVDVPAATLQLDANLAGTNYMIAAAAPGLDVRRFRISVLESIVAVRYIAVVVTEP